jgi:hypothetical protein
MLDRFALAGETAAAAYWSCFGARPDGRASSLRFFA